jgi:hypothetical protein
VYPLNIPPEPTYFQLNFSLALYIPKHMPLSPVKRNVLSDFYLHTAEGTALAVGLNQLHPNLVPVSRLLETGLLLFITCTFLLFSVELKVGRSRYE